MACSTLRPIFLFRFWDIFYARRGKGARGRTSGPGGEWWNHMLHMKQLTFYETMYMVMRQGKGDPGG